MLITHHNDRDRLPRHRHREGYVAVVIAGGYIEAGDRGRLKVAAGHVVVHHAWSAHQDDFEGHGASILNLPLPDGLNENVGEVPDVDEVLRLAQRDLGEAAYLVRDRMTRVDASIHDWPDLLACDLRAESDLVLSTWADGIGVAPSALSRGFAAAYGVSPKRYRLEQRARRALLALPGWPSTLAALAAEIGFADQAHLTRATIALTGYAPSILRQDSARNGHSAIA